mmetsp:Transcript_4861/g.8423  ORF Transcript_4861/g.8423 Transcript_4861/m.8423 type:complete len:244 (-) Transcript_4861:99-830(-)
MEVSRQVMRVKATKPTKPTKKKKKKVAKHVIAAREKEASRLQVEPARDEAEEQQEATTAGEGAEEHQEATTAGEGAEEQQEATTAEEAKGVPSEGKKHSRKPLKRKQRRRAQKHVKDPKEAAAYVAAWKERDSGDGAWKFNKNTQSWLIRHMYDKDKVTKGTFADLIEYLKGLNKGITRMRMGEDARRRAMRYKEFEKSGDAANTRPDDEDHREWAALDDGSKRKEYKRARQIIDMLKEQESD